MDGFLRDARFAVRSLVASRGPSVVALLTLALGIGATTAIFSVLQAVLLRPLPFPRPEQLVVPQSTNRERSSRWTVSYRDYLDWRAHGVFAHVGLYQLPELDLTGDGAPERLTAAVVTEDFFATLEVRPELGRFFAPDEYTTRSERPLVISDALWHRRFGGRPEAIGRTVQVSGLPVTIVGVMPPGEGFPRRADLWYPRRDAISDEVLAPDDFIFSGIARLAPGISREATEARLAALAAVVEHDFPAKRSGITVVATPLRDWLVGPQLQRALWVLFGAVALVLLIGCVNIANVLLARAVGREREIALRTALGASRHRLARQLLTESAILALAGGALGVLVAAWGVPALITLAPPELPLQGTAHVSAAALAFAFGASMLSALAFGVAPAVQLAGVDPATALAATSSRTTASGAARRAGSVLVVGELALSLVLLTGAGLLGRSFSHLLHVDPGLDVSHVVTFQVALPRAHAATRADELRFWATLQQRLEQLPAVHSATIASALPLGGGGFYLGRTLIPAGAPEPPAGSEVTVMWNSAAPDYFRTFGQPLIAGRDFTPHDDSAAPPAIIVNESFVRAMYPGRRSVGDALGQRVFSWRDERVVRTIVGVVGDVRYEGASATPKPVIYTPLAQDPVRDGVVAVRAAGDAGVVLRAASQVLASLDPSIAMARPRTMEDVRSESVARPRFDAVVLGAFAALALLLAAVGTYGLFSYSVTQRRHELGVRIALGATRRDVQWLVLRRALRLAAAGTVIGLAGSLALSRVLASLLYEVRATDPPTLGAVMALLVIVALVATWIPARRASRVDPARAFRTE